MTLLACCLRGLKFITPKVSSGGRGGCYEIQVLDRRLLERLVGLVYLNFAKAQVAETTWGTAIR